MTTVNLSEEGEETLDNIKKTFDVEPSNRGAVERALERYLDYRQGKNSVENNEAVTNNEN